MIDMSSFLYLDILVRHNDTEIPLCDKYDAFP